MLDLSHVMLRALQMRDFTRYQAKRNPLLSGLQVLGEIRGILSGRLLIYSIPREAIGAPLSGLASGARKRLRTARGRGSGTGSRSSAGRRSGIGRNGALQ